MPDHLAPLPVMTALEECADELADEHADGGRSRRGERVEAPETSPQTTRPDEGEHGAAARHPTR